LPEYTQDTLAAYSVAAAGASDWAKQQLICGTFKSAFDIMGLSVEAQALSMGCPDVGTIATKQSKPQRKPTLIFTRFLHHCSN
jgi:hypothetical protein